MRYTPCDPGEVRKERGAREDDRVLDGSERLENKGKARTHVSDRNGEKDEKDPEVQVESLAGGSTLVGYPEREEPEQASRVEGYCQVGLRVAKSISGPNMGENWAVIPAR